MNRSDFKKLTIIRLREAEVLVRAQQYSGAYYLGGYVVECALKACVAKQTHRFDFPDKKIANASYTHDLKELLAVARLAVSLKIASQTNPRLKTNWNVVKAWSEESRYQTNSKKDAKDLLVAIVEQKSGVLPWLQRHW